LTVVLLLIPDNAIMHALAAPRHDRDHRRCDPDLISVDGVTTLIARYVGGCASPTP